MTDSIRSFLEFLRVTGDTLKTQLQEFEKVELVHHDDADGVTAAAIMKIALSEIGLEAKCICLEKAYPQILKRLGMEEGPIIYVDIGSPHARNILKLSPARSLVVIIDHHDPENVRDLKLIHINPELFGISGERECSASVVAYLLARELIGHDNDNLVKLALVGASEIPGAICGLNAIILDKAFSAGVTKKVHWRGKEDYAILEGGKFIPRGEIARKLTILASVGYYRGGVEIAIKACIEGFTPSIEEMSKKLDRERKRLYKLALEEIRRRGIKKDGYISWFHVGDLFINVGSKVLGTFTSYIMHRGLGPRDRYIVGFMNLNPLIPGLGKLDDRYSKISIRVPSQLISLIDNGLRPPASELLIQACKLVGGFGDGHAYAASGIVFRGKERELIRRMNERIETQLRRRGIKRRGTLDQYF